MLVDVGEVFRSGGQIDFVGRPGEVADDEFVVREAGVQQGGQMPEELGTFEECVADQADVVAAVECERQRRRAGRAGVWPRGRLGEDPEAGEGIGGRVGRGVLAREVGGRCRGS